MFALPNTAQPRHRRADGGNGVRASAVQGLILVELLTHSSRVDAQRFYERLGFKRSHVGMTVRF